MIAFLAMLVILITSLPLLRRRSYNTFYYCHVILSALVFILLSWHASTDFYFLLPGLLLWIGDWAWRLLRGMGGLRKTVTGKLENAGEGWYRISLPVSARLASTNDDIESATSEERMPAHPLQSYFLVFPAISKVQNHAFTAATIGGTNSGPTFLFQRSAGKKQKKLDKEWTWKLGAFVNDLATAAKDFKVRVEGPYMPSVPAMFNVSRIVCIVGGTGLTGAYSIAQWWLKSRAHIDGTSLSLVWTIRHRSKAALKEWQELETQVAGNSRVRVILQVTSEQGRLNVNEVLRGNLATSFDGKEKTDQSAASTETAWVYLSGPEGLLQAGESACVEVQRQIRKGNQDFGVQRLDYYSAKWEV